MLEMASSIQSDSAGVSPSHALADDLSVVFCSAAFFSAAILDDERGCDEKVVVVDGPLRLDYNNFWQT